MSEKFMQTFFHETSIEADKDVIQYYSELKVKEAERCLEEETLTNFGVKTQITLKWEEVEEIASGKYMDFAIKITEIYVNLQEETSKETINAMWGYMTKNYCSEVKIE